MKLDYYSWPPRRQKGDAGATPSAFAPTVIDALEPFEGAKEAAAYIPHPDLVSAVNVALVLGKPLLVTGEPGTGKTKLANSVAWQLGYPEPLKFVAKSTSIARDLFYSYDALGRFYAAEAAGLAARGIGVSRGNGEAAGAKGRDAANVLDFVEYAALGKAILKAHDKSAVGWLLESSFSAIAVNHAGPTRSVVVIDEVDKAPRDFPNDLLDEIDTMQFRVVEHSDLTTPPLEDRGMRPVVIITSNRERQLPDAFLRRCLFFEIPFPKRRESKVEKERASPREIGGRYTIEDIVAARIGSSGEAFANSPLVRSALDFLYRIRDLGEPLQKLPATAELIDWLDALRKVGVNGMRSLKVQRQLGSETLFTLLKSREDQATGRRAFESWCSEKE